MTPVSTSLDWKGTEKPAPETPRGQGTRKTFPPTKVLPPANKEGKGMLSMPASGLSAAYGFLIFGVISLILAVLATCTGEAWARFGRVIHRAEDPKQFWWLVAMYYLGGVVFIGAFMYRVSRISH
jgi:hypothetical protein